MLEREPLILDRFRNRERHSPGSRHPRSEHDMRLLAYLLVAITALALLPGCGSETIAPVRGRVTCHGKPVVDAALIFSPIPKNENDKESGKAAAAGTDEDG